MAGGRRRIFHSILLRYSSFLIGSVIYQISLEIFQSQPSFVITHNMKQQPSMKSVITHNMRNVYHHGRFYDGRHFNSQSMEYLLHSSFPFAIEQLCIQFSESSLITGFGIRHEIYIKNHFALWGYQERKQFVYKIDNMKQQKDIKWVIIHQCKEVEYNVFNPLLENVNGVMERSRFYFNFHFYVPESGLIESKLTQKTSFDVLFRIKRNVYNHGRFYDGRHFSSQSMEYLLHSSFPFAIEQLFIQFSESGLINRFWD